MESLSFFSSPIGLGHATRDAAIAKTIQVPIRFVTGSSAARFLSGMGFDVKDLYRPPAFDVRDGSLKRPAKWLWNYYKYYRECKEISRRVIDESGPGLVVSDEDFASLAVAQEAKIPTVLITDVLETRFTRGMASLVEKKMNRSMTELIKKCDVVIVPESGEDRGNIRMVGPIVRHTGSTREELRERFSFDRKTVLVSVGGTDAGRFLIDKVLEAAPKIRGDFEVVVASGPALEKTAGDIRDLGFVGNLHELVFAADVVVSLAGKSTIDEANAYGTPGIFIPIRGHFEQEDNARGEGFAFSDIDRLADLIQEKLGQARGQASGGAAHTAGRMIESLL